MRSVFALTSLLACATAWIPVAAAQTTDPKDASEVPSLACDYDEGFGMHVMIGANARLSGNRSDIWRYGTNARALFGVRRTFVGAVDGEACAQQKLPKECTEAKVSGWYTVGVQGGFRALAARWREARQPGQGLLSKEPAFAYDLALGAEVAFFRIGSTDGGKKMPISRTFKHAGFLLGGHLGASLFPGARIIYSEEVASESSAGAGGFGAINRSFGFSLTTGLRTGLVVAFGNKAITFQIGADLRTPVNGALEIEPLFLIGFARGAPAVIPCPK